MASGQSIMKMLMGDLNGEPMRNVVEVESQNGHCWLAARAMIQAGELILWIDGRITEFPHRYSVQLDWHSHIYPELDLDPLDIDGRYAWRFMNHHCEPSAVIRGLDVLALRTIRSGEEITYNYNTTEFEMAEPFACRCGSPRCLGVIQGFNYLPREEQELLRPYLAPYLLRILDSETQFDNDGAIVACGGEMNV
jgi:hypothetical protein